jgi:hypothetical protein
MRNRKTKPLYLCGIFTTLLLAADPGWKTKPTAEWTERDATEVLTASPWARQVMAGVAGRQSEDELRDGGRMGQPTGIGYEGVDSKSAGPKLPTKLSDLVVPAQNGGRSVRSMAQGLPVRLRWESALPVKIAELKAHLEAPPTLEGNGYRIGVYGLPGGHFQGDPKKLGDRLKQYAVLRREGKKDVQASSAEVFPQGDGWAVVYLFPLSAEVSPKDKQLTFDARIGRIVVVQLFDLTQMIFQGKLEI